MTSPMDDGVETAEEARQGEDDKGMNAMLRVSLIAVVALFAVLLIYFFVRTSSTGRATSDQVPPPAARSISTP